MSMEEEERTFTAGQAEAFEALRSGSRRQGVMTRPAASVSRRSSQSREHPRSRA